MTAGHRVEVHDHPGVRGRAPRLGGLPQQSAKRVAPYRNRDSDSAYVQVCLIDISATRAVITGMTSQPLAIDHRGEPSRPHALTEDVGLPTGNPVAQLSDALQILTSQLREAVAQRRSANPASELYRRADERVAYLNELYVRLQRRMEIPPEIWLLDGGRTPSRDQRLRSQSSLMNLSPAERLGPRLPPVRPRRTPGA